MTFYVIIENRWTHLAVFQTRSWCLVHSWRGDTKTSCCFARSTCLCLHNLGPAAACGLPMATVSEITLCVVSCEAKVEYVWSCLVLDGLQMTRLCRRSRVPFQPMNSFRPHLVWPLYLTDGKQRHLKRCWWTMFCCLRIVTQVVTQNRILVCLVQN